MSECKRSLPDDLKCELPDGHKGACKGREKRCLCYYAIADFDGIHHDRRCPNSPDYQYRPSQSSGPAPRSQFGIPACEVVEPFDASDPTLSSPECQIIASQVAQPVASPPMQHGVHFIQQLPGGICFAHGPYEKFVCPKWPACATDPQKQEYIAMGADKLRPVTSPTAEEVAASYFPADNMLLGFAVCQSICTAACRAYAASLEGRERLLKFQVEKLAARVRTLEQELHAEAVCDCHTWTDIKEFHIYTVAVEKQRDALSVSLRDAVENAPKLSSLADWLENEAEDLAGKAIAREESGKCMIGATRAELKAAKSLSEKMAGRKLPDVSTDPEEAREYGEMQNRIAKKLDAQSQQLAGWSGVIRALLTRLSSQTQRGKNAPGNSDGVTGTGE